MMFLLGLVLGFLLSFFLFAWREHWQDEHLPGKRPIDGETLEKLIIEQLFHRYDNFSHRIEPASGQFVFPDGRYRAATVYCNGEQFDAWITPDGRCELKETA